MPSGGSPPPLRHLLLALYALVCMAALVWPGYAWLGNRIEPVVLGLPLSFAWNVGWVVLTFAVVGVYHLTSGEEG
jgi:hypothetical protein